MSGVVRTVLLRLEGPLQSWGTQSRFEDRDTEREPSKSGVLGLVAAALGVPRTDDAALARLAALAMAVRVDREGTLLSDYHTAGVGDAARHLGGVLRASGGVRPDAVLSTRHYLADASFLLALGGDADLIRAIDTALGRPRWPLSLGRKACLPAVPIRVPNGLSEAGPRDALLAAPFPRHLRRGPDAPTQLRLVVEAAEATPDVRNDVPLSFARGSRRFAARCVRTEFIPIAGLQVEEVAACT